MLKDDELEKKLKLEQEKPRYKKKTTNDLRRERSYRPTQIQFQRPNTS
jgi:hypothetical protein